MMDANQRFLDIFQNEKIEDVLFIQSLSPEEKKNLFFYFHTIANEYLITGKNNEVKATPTQAKIYLIAAFQFSKKEFQEVPCRPNVFVPKFLEPALDIFCPKWFNDFLNKEINLTWHYPYESLMRLAEKGHISPGRALLAHVLPWAITEWDRHIGKHYYRPENLLKWKVTLDEHIWILFEEPTPIANVFSTRAWFVGELPEGDPWMAVLRDLSLSGAIDRKRLLKEALLVGNRNFNKVQSGWFAELFEKLSPTPDELLAMQDELMLVFSSSHSKVAGTSLNAIKEIAEHPAFDVGLFESHCGSLLTSGTKALVNNSLAVIDKLIKKHKDRTDALCVLATQALIHKEESIQSRAAKLILKYAKKPSPEVEKAVKQYVDTMLVSTKELLTGWGDDSAPSESTPIVKGTEAPSTSYVHKYHPIESGRTVDELVFLASQALDNNSPWHIDLLPAAVVALQDELKGAHLAKFESALQRAYRRVTSHRPTGTGFLDTLLAVFLIDVFKILSQRYPSDSKHLDEHHKFYQVQNEQWKKQYQPDHPFLLRETKDWKVRHTDVYSFHQSILTAAIDKLKTSDKLPLLSTPTHEPGVVDATVLIERLSKYQAVNKTPDATDFQVAISRCWIKDNTADAAAKILSDEYLRLFQFLCGKTDLPEGPFTHHAVWLVAGTRRSVDTIYREFSGFPYSEIPHSYFTGRFPCTVGPVNHGTNMRFIVLQITIDKKISKDASVVKNFWSKLVSSDKEPPKLIYDLQAGTVEEDLDRMLCLFPYNPEPLLARVVSSYGRSSSMMEAQPLKMLTVAAARLTQLNFNFGGTAHVFVAICMLNENKTLRAFAAEIWAKGVANGTIDSEELGQGLGACEAQEFAPLQRFSDVVAGHMINISASHNKSLEQLLEAMLIQLPSEPMKNLKKLLEVTLEVKAANNSKVTQAALKEKLSTWEKSATLKKVIASLK